MSKTTVLILAAGSGKRMGEDVPKQFKEIASKPVLAYSMEAFDKSLVDEIIIVGTKEYEATVLAIAEAYKIKKFTKLVYGDKERYLSVYKGLECIKAEENDKVLVHDAARPLISVQKINELIETLDKEKAAVLAVPVKDTVRKVNSEGVFEESLDRSNLYAIQTPQGFNAGNLKEAYEVLMSDENLQKGITDDAMVLERVYNIKARLIQGEYKNIKLTTKEDTALVEIFLKEE